MQYSKMEKVMIVCGLMATLAFTLCSTEETTSSVELTDGILMSFPLQADQMANPVVNFTMNVKRFNEGLQVSGRDGKEKKLLKRILPLFILPFLIQSAIIPMFLSTLKMMLVKSIMIGKLALLLIAFNALKTSNVFKSRSEESIAKIHYGYHGAGMEEYGTYIN